MNRTAIRNFATWARTTLIEQVRSRLHTFGISEKGIIPAQNVAGGIVVNGQTLNGEDADHYHQLKSLIDTSGLVGAALIAKITEEIAYIWFNRLAALRFMEVNGYLSYRCLSSGDPNLVDPEILREVGAIAAAGDFEELDFAKLTEWRELAASQPNPDEWLYRKLLLVQCRDLSKSIACLFDRDKDYTLLFLPPNLLNSDSILKKLVSAIAEEDWLDIEIVGWLYQFYISEKKDEVIGAKSKVKAEDIPAATQLFTPHWIVRYMVENSLGRLWLEAHPESGLREKMSYYLDCPHPLAPSPTRGEGGQENTLAPLSLNGRGAGGEGLTNPPHPLTPSPTRGEGGQENLAPSSLTPPLPQWERGLGGEGLTPQDLTVCDPACGSGHILVYAFDLLFEIYREQGYSDREIPALILEHNLFGLDIDDRAVQLASFAVLMKARARDKRFLRRVAELPRLNILWVRNTRQFFNEREMAKAEQGAIASYQMSLGGLGLVEQLPLGYVAPKAIASASLVSFLTENASLSGELLGLLRVFLDADHLGSLIVPPVFDADRVYGELDRLELSFPIYRDDFGVLRDVVRQAVFLRRQFRVVVANPPYMGDGSFNDVVKAFVNQRYKAAKGDLYGAFIIRDLELCAENGSVAMLTIPNWMFLSSFEDVRKLILKNYFLESLVHNGRGVFGSDFGSCSFTIRNRRSVTELGIFKRLFDKQGSVASNEELEQRFFTAKSFYTNPQDFGKIPSSAIAYWVSDRVKEIFASKKMISEIAETRKGMGIGDNARFVRQWFEPSFNNIILNAKSSEEALKSGKKWFPYNDGGSFRKWYGNNEVVVNWENNGDEAKISATIKNSGKHWSRYLVSLDYFFKSGITWTAISSANFSARIFGHGFLFSSAGMCLYSNVEIEHNLITLLNSCVGSLFLKVVSPTLNFGSGEIGRIPVIEVKSDINNYQKLIDLSRQDWDNFETSWDFKTHPLTRYKTNLIQQAFENWQKETESAFQQLKQLEEENNRYWIAAYGLQDELTPEVPDAQITIRRADLTRDIKSLLSYAVGCIMGRYSLESEGLVDASDPHPLAPSPRTGEGGQENLVPSSLAPLSLNGRGAGGEGLINPPHPLTPSPTRGEGEPENTLTPPLPTWERGLGGEGESPLKWEISPQLHSKMAEVARQFRKQSTKSEAILWESLRGRRLDNRKFRRQQPIGAFIVDFYCPTERLIVEVDGEIHNSQQQSDRDRQEILESLGLRFVRIASNQVETDINSALKIISEQFIDNSPHPLAPSPRTGEGGQENTLTPPLPSWERGLGGEGLFPPTKDGITPITDKAYFTDDIVDQIIEFLKTAYSHQHLQANLDYIAIALTLRTGENSRDRIRRYFLDEFVKDHIQTYKKRPIYWYFTSGKKKAFGALVYLHKYDTNTLARLRTDYVLELQRKIDNELQREQQNLALLTTTAAKKASQKLIKDLQDQQLELREYQAKLQHAADKRIAIDLDDGVAYNYTLFEGLVYEGAELKMADLKKKSEWKRKNQ